jgi:hypothetical protein
VGGRAYLNFNKMKYLIVMVFFMVSCSYEDARDYIPQDIKNAEIKFTHDDGSLLNVSENRVGLDLRILNIVHKSPISKQLEVDSISYILYVNSADKIERVYKRCFHKKEVCRTFTFEKWDILNFDLIKNELYPIRNRLLPASF